MRTRLLLVVTVAIASLAAACGGSSGSTGAPSTTASGATDAFPTTTVHVAEVAKATPSLSAKMVCEKEAIDDIYNSATGVKTLTPPKATWDKSTHVYTCVYPYEGGAQMSLVVKEMSSTAETTAYFDQLASQLGKTQEIAGLGQGAYQVRNGSMVVRKDYKVMLVDITKLPAQFGVPSDSRGNVAINVAETIMGCWTGA